MTSETKELRAARRYSLFIAAVVLVPFIITIALNYVVDPFGVFQTGWFPKQIEINDRFLKVEFLDAHRDRFNGLMWGSSRIGNTPPAVIERYNPGGRFYNMWYGNGTLGDHRDYIKYITATHPEISQHYIEIDVDMFMGMSEWGAAQIGFWRHPAVEHHSKVAFYAENLVTMPLRVIAKKAYLNLTGGEPPVRYELETTGIWVDDRLDRKIANDMAGHLRDFDQMMNFNPVRRVRATQDQNNAAALAEIVQICREHSLRCTFFTTPHHASVLNTLLTPDFLRCIRLIAGLTPFWDFASYNSVTTSNALYYEGSHFRQPVAELMAARIFSNSEVAVPADFGIRVNKDNIDEVIKSRAKNFKDYELKHLAETAERGARK
ncbi:hypothetical protein [Rhodoplanes sp. Z2-YC6860]|uniref:hypothetical protein n=1 Tax=Rhodoplanes sp. Z2-YC6860 TaxID=674703 RepID=UPI00078E5A9E|nr:hypothetical protein [Rhodoplanes sp. Z2-YC6860]AMN44050.1 polysaccharide deacetylase [Rhodoplanes sp. Z2-YC6860]